MDRSAASPPPALAPDPVPRHTVRRILPPTSWSLDTPLSSIVRELLDPHRPSSSEAQELVRDYLKSGRKRWLFALLSFPAERRRDIAVLLAWQVLVCDAIRASAQLDTQLGAALRQVDELRRVIDNVYSGTPNCAVGVALRPIVAQYELSAMSFQASLDEHLKGLRTSSFSTRDELLRHARRLGQGQAHLFARVAGLAVERQELLAQNLALGLTLTDWLEHLSEDFALGLLRIPVEDITRHGIDLMSVWDPESGKLNEALAPAIAGQVRWARELLARGWPLCAELGPWRGRSLAFVLRWNAATLSALEARDFQPGPAPRAGWLRLIACGSFSLATRSAPSFP